MHFFVYCRDRPGTEELRPRLAEAHWAYMDPYQDSLLARGPTLTADGQRMTGSLHVIDLPDVATAQRYVAEEPFHRAGVYAAVDLLGWDDILGRTMWEFRSAARDPSRFLVIGHAGAEAGEPDAALLDGQRHAWRGDPRLIAAGFLRSVEQGRWQGFALLAELPEERAARRLAEESSPSRAGLLREVEVHRWRFGGRQ